MLLRSLRAGRKSIIAFGEEYGNQQELGGSIHDIALAAPVSVLHPDSGEESINRAAKRWREANGIRLTHSQPYQKNDNPYDNPYKEERNGNVLGHQRSERPEIVPILNELCDILAQYLNHFRVHRMIAKERLDANDIRRYETTARTPHQRALAHNQNSKRHAATPSGRTRAPQSIIPETTK